jgi:hypothetical protein
MILSGNAVNSSAKHTGKAAHLNKGTADQGVRGHKPAIPINGVPGKPLDGRTGIFNHSVPFQDV